MFGGKGCLSALFSLPAARTHEAIMIFIRVKACACSKF